jgi:hypothetical protein
MTNEAVSRYQHCQLIKIVPIPACSGQGFLLFFMSHPRTANISECVGGWPGLSSYRQRMHARTA